MAIAPIAGNFVNIDYGWETTFSSASGSINKAFSQGVKLTSYDIDNSADYIYALGSQDAQKSVVKEFKGTWGVEFLLSDPWFFRAILGGAPVDAGSAPYTHTWTIANSGIATTLTSMTMDLGYDLDVDSAHQLLGCISNTMSLTCSVGEAVKVRLEGSFANMTKGTVLASYASPVEEPFTFAQGSLQFPSGTTMTDVQSCEISFNRNADMIFALGSRHPQKNVAKQREWNIKVSQTYEQDTDYLDHVLGSTTAPTTTVDEVATCILTITNGGAGSATRSYVFTFANCLVEKISIPASVEEVVKQEVTIRARSLTSLVVSNNTSTAL